MKKLRISRLALSLVGNRTRSTPLCRRPVSDAVASGVPVFPGCHPRASRVRRPLIVKRASSAAAESNRVRALEELIPTHVGLPPWCRSFPAVRICEAHAWLYPSLYYYEPTVENNSSMGLPKCWAMRRLRSSSGWRCPESQHFTVLGATQHTSASSATHLSLGDCSTLLGS